MSKSWKLTLTVYIFAIVVSVGVTFTDIELDDSQINFIGQMITTLVGSTTAGGAFVGAMKHRGAVNAMVKELKAIVNQPQSTFENIKKKVNEI